MFQQATVQNGALRPPATGIPVAQGVPQIRQQPQVNISQQQQRISGQMGLAANRAMANAQAQHRQGTAQEVQMRQLAAQALLEGRSHPAATSLAAGAAPALTAHLSPPYNAQRATSSSPGLPQQSPPLAQAIAQSMATSPRPPSAQAPMTPTPGAGASRPTPALASYYGMNGVPNGMPTSVGVPGPTQQLSTDQITHAERIRAMLLQVL